jgi:steroid 5-alpha reductase family enzyme
MNTILDFLILLAGLAVVMALLWWLQRATRNAGWVDVAWSASIGVLALAHAWTGVGALWPRALAGILAALWSFRLAAHLARRVAGELEDGRYRALRDHWGERADSGMFWFFQAQALVALLFSLPIWAAAQNPVDQFNAWWAAALAVWILSVAGEALADRQLHAFRTDPANRGRTCRRGLWSWSRHPNYFFEWLHWFTYVLIAVGSPYWWLTLAGPVFMFAFLYRFTGIPFTERQALKSRGEDYRRYQREVSPFLPLPPRNQGDSS